MSVKMFVNGSRTVMVLLRGDSAEILNEIGADKVEKPEPEKVKRTYKKRGLGRRSKLDETDKDEIKTAYGEGRSAADLAKEYGVSSFTIYKVVKGNKSVKKQRAKNIFEKVEGIYVYKCTRGHIVHKRTDKAEEIECPMPDCGATAFRQE